MLKNFPIDSKTPPRHLLDDSVIEDGGLRYTFYRKADINKWVSDLTVFLFSLLDSVFTTVQQCKESSV